MAFSQYEQTDLKKLLHSCTKTKFGDNLLQRNTVGLSICHDLLTKQQVNRMVCKPKPIRQKSSEGIAENKVQQEIEGRNDQNKYSNSRFQILRNCSKSNPHFKPDGRFSTVFDCMDRYDISENGVPMPLVAKVIDEEYSVLAVREACILKYLKWLLSRHGCEFKYVSHLIDDYCCGKPVTSTIGIHDKLNMEYNTPKWILEHHLIMPKYTITLFALGELQQGQGQSQSQSQFSQHPHQPCTQTRIENIIEDIGYNNNNDDTINGGTDSSVTRCTNFINNIRNISFQLVLSLAILHSQGIIHGDIKPENIFIHFPFLKEPWVDDSSSTFVSPYSNHCRSSPLKSGNHHRHPNAYGNKGFTSANEHMKQFLLSEISPLRDGYEGQGGGYVNTYDVHIGDFGSALLESEVCEYYCVDQQPYSDIYTDSNNNNNNTKKQTVYKDFSIQSLPYRSPEVLLGQWRYNTNHTERDSLEKNALPIPFDTSIDMWSMGVMILELCLGSSSLFHYEDKDKLISALYEVFEMPSTSWYHYEDGCRVFDSTDGREGFSIARHMSKIKSLLLTTSIYKNIEVLLTPSFLQFISYCLHPDPACRLTAVSALSHPYFTTPTYAGIRPCAYHPYPYATLSGCHIPASLLPLLCHTHRECTGNKPVARLVPTAMVGYHTTRQSTVGDEDERTYNEVKERDPRAIGVFQSHNSLHESQNSSDRCGGDDITEDERGNTGNAGVATASVVTRTTDSITDLLGKLRQQKQKQKLATGTEGGEMLGGDVSSIQTTKTSTPIKIESTIATATTPPVATPATTPPVATPATTTLIRPLDFSGNSSR